MVDGHLYDLYVMKILITGCAGFIGFHLANFLLYNTKHDIYGIDSINSYYDIKIKKDRLLTLKSKKKFKFYKFNLCNQEILSKNFKKNKYDIVINLAAQAGVRHSIDNPDEYFDNNLTAFYNIINLSRIHKIKHFIYASSSSVYGDLKKFPLKENNRTDFPLSFYAATKKCNEIIAYSFSNIYKLRCTGLRFFTVYGTFGRPDMALYKFLKNITSNKPIEMNNNGKHVRDWTYVDDVINQISKIINLRYQYKSKVPYNILNIGSNNPKSLKYFLKLIEKNLDKKAIIKYKKFQVGDVYKTHADNSLIENITKTKIKVSIENGIAKVVKWYKDQL